jgi:hypothetical protein
MTPLLDKFNLLSLGDKDGQPADAYNITMRLVQMIEHFERYDLQNVCYIVKTTEETDSSLKLEGIYEPDHQLC